MTALDTLVRDFPKWTFSFLPLDDDSHAAMAEAETADTVRVGWGAGRSVEEAVNAAMACAADDRKEAA